MSDVAVWKPYDPCVCGCGVIHQKTTRPLRKGEPAHVIGCKCRPHIGKRSAKKGRKAHIDMHRNLGADGVPPRDEEKHKPYPILVQAESKVGGQVPVGFDLFLKTQWFRRALGQAERAVPVGSGAKPAVVVRGRWMVVDLRRRGRTTDDGATP